MVSTVSSATIAAISSGIPSGGIVVSALLILLIMKEIIGFSDLPRAKTLSQYLNLPIFSLMIVLAMILMLNVITFG